MNLDKMLMIGPATLPARIEQEARERVIAALAAELVDRERPDMLAALRAALEDLKGLKQTDLEAADALAAAERKVSELSAIAPRDETWIRPEDMKAAQALKVARSELDAAQSHARYSARVIAGTRARAQELEDKIRAIEGMAAPDPAVLSAIRGKVGGKA